MTKGRRTGVSPKTDELSSTLMGAAFDRLALGTEMGVLVVVADVHDNLASYEFTDDGEEALLEGAYDRIRDLLRTKGDPDIGLETPVRYAIAYEGVVADEQGSYQDALLLEFGEKGYKSYSAYSFITGKGQEEHFQWSDPAPAGEVEPLV